MTTRRKSSHSKVIKSGQSAINGVYRNILSELQSNGFGSDDIFAVHLALEEAFINAVKHGNKMDTGKDIRIDYSVSPDKIEISVADQGSGFDPESVPDPRDGENIYKTGGRGLFLMRSYMDVVSFNKRGSCVNMVRYRGK